MTRHVEVSGLTPWTNAVLAATARSRSSKRIAQHAFQVSLESGNIDARVTAYRACPELLRILVQNEANHAPLKAVLERARDDALGQAVGLRLPTLPEKQGRNSLSKREREVLELLGQGLTNKEIAKTLFITESTTKVHVRKICQKLGVRSRTQAALRAAEEVAGS